MLTADYEKSTVTVYFLSLTERVEASMLAACVASRSGSNPALDAVVQHLKAGGSRLRSRLCLSASLRLGLVEADAVCLASTCELLHNASLVQDDLMDRAPMRRGQTSAWAFFGQETAVLAGDLMLSAAYASLVAFSDARRLPELLRLVHNRTSEVILGQASEKASNNKEIRTLTEYEILARGKSFSLLALPLELPLSASGLHHYLEAAQEIAGAFSVAYQIADDLEDVQEDAASGTLNIVGVLSCDGLHSLGSARTVARERACELLRTAVARAAPLPNACASVMISHARSLLDQLATIEFEPLAVKEQT